MSVTPEMIEAPLERVEEAAVLSGYFGSLRTDDLKILTRFVREALAMRPAMPSPDRTLVERVAWAIRVHQVGEDAALRSKEYNNGKGSTGWNYAVAEAKAALSAMSEASDLEGKCAEMREALEQ